MMIKKKFPVAFNCAIEVAKELKQLNNIEFPEQELGYISLHIERLRKLV